MITVRTIDGQKTDSCTVNVTGTELCTVDGSCTIEESNNCSAMINVHNLSNQELSAIVVLAIYDDSGKLCATKETDVKVTAQKTAQFSITDVQCKDLSAEWKAKVFVLNKETYEPLSSEADLFRWEHDSAGGGKKIGSMRVS